MSGFVRPQSIAYPYVYYTFQARDLHSNKLVNYRVEDFPRDRIEEGIQYMIQNFFEHEVMGKSRRIKSDRVAVLEISQFWRKVLPKGFSIACFKENSSEIIAMNVLDVLSIKDPKDDSKVNFRKIKQPWREVWCLTFVFVFTFQFQSQNLNDIFGVMSHAQEQFNVFQRYNVEEYLIAYGLCVDTSYRGCGVATEMLKARAPMLKALGLTVTTTAFTGVGSQKAAEKAGYEENFVITWADQLYCSQFCKFKLLKFFFFRYDDLFKVNEDFYFPGISATHFKTMSLKL
jgi:GNAT superfamily N-acetyltransferase